MPKATGSVGAKSKTVKPEMMQTVWIVLSDEVSSGMSADPPERATLRYLEKQKAHPCRSLMDCQCLPKLLEAEEKIDILVAALERLLGASARVGEEGYNFECEVTPWEQARLAITEFQAVKLAGEGEGR